MPSIRLTGDIAHIMEGTRAQAADLNLTLAEDGFPVAVTIRKGPLEVLTEAESGAIFCGSRVEFFRGLTMLGMLLGIILGALVAVYFLLK